VAQLSAPPNHGPVFPQPHYQFDHHVHTLLASRPPAGSPLIPFLQIFECVDADARHQQQGSKANATSIVIVIADAEVSSNVTNWSALNREDVNRHDGQASATDKSAISVTQNYRSVCRSPVDNLRGCRTSLWCRWIRIFLTCLRERSGGPAAALWSIGPRHGARNCACSDAAAWSRIRRCETITDVMATAPTKYVAASGWCAASPRRWRTRSQRRVDRFQTSRSMSAAAR